MLKLEMPAKSAVQVSAEVAMVLAIVSSFGPAAPPCDSGADLSTVEKPPC
jgi:hypothetical protein